MVLTAGSSTTSRLTVSRLLDRSVELWPDKVAVVSGETTLTYASLRAMSCRFARYLQSIGISEGQRVSLILPNSLQFVVCFFAIARIGAVLVPLNRHTPTTNCFAYCRTRTSRTYSAFGPATLPVGERIRNSAGRR